MREKRESGLGFGDRKEKKEKKYFWYFAINVKQGRKKRQTEYTL